METAQKPAHRVAAVLIAAALCGATSAAGHGLDRNIAEVWPATRAWNADYEAKYSAFVATIGRAVAARRCGTLARCLNNPAINPLYEPGGRLHLHADCADLPYVLRAYFAYRMQLPFAYAAGMRGHGHDPRYMTSVRPVGLHTWTEFRTPRALLQQIGSDVHSGYMRTAPEVETSDFYQAAVDRGAVRPGTVYYDPNGHVLVVYDVGPDGDVLLFDAHPDNSITFKRFDEHYPLGSARQGGGFKNFRPIEYRAGRIVQLANAQIPQFGGREQFQPAGYRVAGRVVGYHDWVRLRLRTGASMPTASRTPAASGVPGVGRTSWTRPRRVRTGPAMRTALWIQTGHARRRRLPG